jgi:ERF superfamily
MVHKKLMNARMMLQQTELKKSGHNKFSNYYYFELGDFLPQINQIFHTLGLCGVISYTKDYADLTITDVDDGTFITISSPMVEANLKGAHAIQNLGAVETYQRRYLWMTAMEIVEHDALDSSAPLKEEKKAPVIAPAQGIREELPIEELRYLDELAVELIAICEKDPKAAWVRLEKENLEADQKVALWTLMPSNVRAAIKKAKEV